VSSFFSRLTLELETGETVNKEEDIALLNHYVETIDSSEFVETMQYADVAHKIETIERLLKMCVNPHGCKLVKKMIACKTAEEFAQKALFDISNAIGHNSKLILRELAYKNKEEVIKAISFFSAPNSWEYLIREYGSTPKAHEKFISNIAMVYPFIGTSLASIKNLFNGLNENITPFEFCIADEAGMITSIDMIPALQLSDKAVIVGDTKQLQPIFSIDDMFSSSIRTLVNDDAFWKQYSPMEVSAFHLAAGMKSANEIGFGKAIFLNEHRRCQPAIAELAKAIIPEYASLNVETTPIKNTKNSSDLDYFNKIGTNLMFLNVKNSNTQRSEKINHDEVAKIDKLLSRLEAIGFDLTKDVGIISPYAAQASLLTKTFGNRLGQREGVEARIGTVHKFQGAEYKIIILSTVVSKETDSLNFINNGPYMVNVAVTRAKNHLFVVGDYDKLTSNESADNYIGKISKIIKTTGKFA
jgi:hypothetical protein